MNSIRDSLVHGGKDVGIEATVFPADLVSGDSGFRGHSSGFALSVVKQTCVGNDTACGGGRGVRAVAFGVSRRLRFGGFIDWSIEVGFVAFVKGFGADDLSIAGGRGEVA